MRHDGAPDAAFESESDINTPRALIADDEEHLRDYLEAQLKTAWPELRVIAKAANGLEALRLIDEEAPDVAFLDIRMPGLTGVEAARQIAQMGDEGEGSGDDDWLVPEIVFITAYDQYAVEAFEQGVADYVLKPAERERLQLTVARIKKRLAQREAPSNDFSDSAPVPLQQLLHKLSAQVSGGGTKPNYLQWIQATVGQAIQMIPVDEVLFFISDEKYTRVQTAKVEALIRKPIKELVDELDPQVFWQVHRSTLVNARAIDGITRDFRGRQLVGVRGLTEKLEVSRSYTHLFKGM